MMKSNLQSLLWLLAVAASSAFSPSATTTTTTRQQRPAFTTAFRRSSSSSTTTSSTALFAIGVLAKKAKQAELRTMVQEGRGVEEEVMEAVEKIKENADKVDLVNQSPGPLQESLTRRKGTITVIAELKRTTTDEGGNGRISDAYDAELLGPQFRTCGAAAVAVAADERRGGCTLADLRAFVEEQRRAKNGVPDPIPVINGDLVVDELQIAQTAAYGAAACVITLGVVGDDDLPGLLRAAAAVDVEPIVAVATADEAQSAVDAGARMLCVVGADGIDAKVAVIEGLVVPDGQQVCTIADILAQNDNQLREIEEAWAIRDKGFNCAWVGEALYKAGADATESPGAIIKSMKSKSSLKWGSPKVSTGKGEGAKEYLGDIMM